MEEGERVVTSTFHAGAVGELGKQGLLQNYPDEQAAKQNLPGPDHGAEEEAAELGRF